MAADDSNKNKWDYPPHTKAKHDILAAYLDGWYPILSRWNGRIVFFDGFAGRGRYNDGSEGSPLVALRRLVEHQRFTALQSREFVFYLVEASKDNASSLEAEIDALKRAKSPWPANVHIHVIQGKFDVTATAMIEHLRDQKRQLAPTFAFIDPFGYSGLPMNLLAELLNYPQAEIFVNFMVGHVQRFIQRDGQERAMSELFGMDVGDVLDGYNGQTDRVQHLHEVYVQQLRDRVGFPYVQSFAMINTTGNTGYYLLHGTRHQKGVELMKEAMWRVDPGGGNTFSDRLAGQNILFGLQPDLGPLRSELLRHYASRKDISIGDIEWHTILNTPFRKKHVREVLRPLEKDKVIEVHRPPGKRQFADGVTISFPG